VKPQPPVGDTSDRLAGVSAAARGLHRAILRGFAATGAPPDVAGQDMDVLLRELHDRDVVRLDEHGAVRAAYPFSARPTAHTVAVAGGPTVYAMCAIDALGIAAMLGRDIVVRSTDRQNGRPVTVTIHDGHAQWEPVTAVVYNGAYGGDCCTPAVDRRCTVMNFFTDRASAHGWLATHPDVSGEVLDQDQALRLGTDIFGRLLDE
jgi:hypothetical protein